MLTEVRVSKARLQDSKKVLRIFKVQGTKRGSPHPKHAKQDPEMGGVVKESESKANGTSAVDVSNPALMTSRYTKTPLPTPLSPAPDACSPFIPDPKSCPPSQHRNLPTEEVNSEVTLVCKPHDPANALSIRCCSSPPHTFNLPSSLVPLPFDISSSPLIYIIRHPPEPFSLFCSLN